MNSLNFLHMLYLRGIIYQQKFPYQVAGFFSRSCSSTPAQKIIKKICHSNNFIKILFIENINFKTSLLYLNPIYSTKNTLFKKI
jgi:hypothetical protein